MFTSRPITTEASRARFPCPMKQYSTDGKHIPLKKNWLDTRCTLQQEFDKVLMEILDYEVRPDDVFVVTFIKCGTTWMQETAWLLMNNLDFERSKRIPLVERSVFIEFHGIVPTAPNQVEFSKLLVSPRLIKSHMPANLLPRQIWERKQKIIYVARNCKDVVVSSYHFIMNLGAWTGDNIVDFVHDFLNNEVMYTHFWTHIVDFWKMRHEPYICFVTYEEMQRDLAGVIRKLCKFLDKPQLTEREIQKLLQHLSFQSMRVNKRINLTQSLKDQLPDVKDNFQFMRRGIVGSYLDELTPELQTKIDNWSREFLSQHGLTEEEIFGKI